MKILCCLYLLVVDICTDWVRLSKRTLRTAHRDKNWKVDFVGVTLTQGLGEQRTSTREVLCWLARTLYELKENIMSMGMHVRSWRYASEVRQECRQDA